MSDPVTNVEIEDVLSSIRRLVSNTGEAGGEQGQPSDKSQEPVAERAAKPVDAGLDRLVLTPSLRVDSGQEDASDAAPEETADPAGDEPDFMVNLTDHNPVHAVSDLPDAGEEAPFIEAVDEEPVHSADVTDLGREAPAASDLPDAGPTPQEAQAMAEAAEGDAADHARIDADAAWGAPEGALQARIAELEAAVATREEDWEPDGTTSEAYSGGEVEALPWEDFNGSDDLSDMGPDGAATDDLGATADPMASPAPRAEDQLTDTVEPGLADLQGDETTDPKAAEPEGAKPEVAEAAAGTEDEPAAEDPLGAEGDAILDEEALRDLVAEIVRDELQGALGERITRNVRKLVRREIHRAMAVQDLE